MDLENRNLERGFTGFVLLDSPDFERETFIKDFKEMWKIEITAKEHEQYSLFFEYDSMLAVISLIPIPVPDHEASVCAKHNYMWKDAVVSADRHSAHLIVAVVGEQEDINKKAELFVKMLATTCKMKNNLGIYTNSVVYEPAQYLQLSKIMEKGMLPIYNLIWFGMYRNGEKFSAYTVGMKAFDYDEMEVIDADCNPLQLQTFMTSIAAYVLENQEKLKDNDTIGFNGYDVHKIHKSSGVALPDETLKIEY